MLDITEHYPQINLHSLGINTERTPTFDSRKFLFQIQREGWITTHIPPAERVLTISQILTVRCNFGGPYRSK